MALSIRTWLKRYWSSSNYTPPRPSVRLHLERLEERDCPAVFNIAAGDTAGLIAAITTSNANNQADTINLAAGSTYTISTVNNTALGNGGLPVVALDTTTANSVTINGNGATIQRSTAAGTPNFRILQVTGALNLNAVTIQNGNTNDADFGAGIDVGAGGVLNVSNAAIINNINQTQPGGGVGIETGAGAVTISNSTISGNMTLSAGATGNGAGVEALTAGALTIVQSTIANNQAGGVGGGLRVVGGTATVTNTILSGNTDATGNNDVSNAGTITAASSIIRTSSGTAIGGAFSTADPLLGVLKNNGGLTPTHSLAAGSPAIDAGSNASAPGTTDQRGPGFNRIIGATVDIGAYEFQPTAVSVALTSSVNPSTVGRPVTFTATVAGTAVNSNIPQGAVTFFVNGAATATATLRAGRASTTISTLPVGTHTVVAVYNPSAIGDYTFITGTSNTVTQKVNAATVIAKTPISRRWRR